MGDDPGSSVLNRWCRAHEVNNLYVVDGSPFPTGTEQTQRSLSWPTHGALPTRSLQNAAAPHEQPLHRSAGSHQARHSGWGRRSCWWSLDKAVKQGISAVCRLSWTYVGKIHKRPLFRRLLHVRLASGRTDGIRRVPVSVSYGSRAHSFVAGDTCLSRPCTTLRPEGILVSANMRENRYNGDRRAAANVWNGSRPRPGIRVAEPRIDRQLAACPRS